MTENKIVKIKEAALVLEPRELLEKAIASGAGVDVIERLLALQERWEAAQNKKAFNVAIAQFKQHPPEILKTVEVDFDTRSGGRKSYKHEDLAELLAAVDPALAKHGLWVRFKVNSDGGQVTVTCVVGHADGYSEADNTLSAAPDVSGSKNPVQAIGSTVSYLQRYTLKAALGLAAARDDDGRGSGNGIKNVSEEQIEKMNVILREADPKVEKKLLELAIAKSIPEIESVKFDACMVFLKKYAKAKK